MADITLVQIVLYTVFALAGIVIGWGCRNIRSRREKMAITAGWQAQLDSQQSEHERLADQNKSLMEQVSQYQASNKDSKMRARELSDSLKEAFSRRDELQRQMKEIRGNLEVAIVQRDNFKSDAQSHSIRNDATVNAIKEKDDEIAKLMKSLASWQNRVPPLVERYRQRDLETRQLETELRQANDRIATLESISRNENTRIEPLDANSLPNGLDASNQPHDETRVDDPPEGGSVVEAGTQAAHEISHTTGGIEARETFSTSAKTETSKRSHETEQHVIFEQEAQAGDAENNALPDFLGTDQPVSRYEDDDLKKIKGIGPAIEKTLNDLGISRFNQIAEISEYDIDRVAQQLRGFRSRIYRQDWIGQARQLQRQKNHTGNLD